MLLYSDHAGPWSSLIIEVIIDEVFFCSSPELILCPDINKTTNMTPLHQPCIFCRAASAYTLVHKGGVSKYAKILPDMKKNESWNNEIMVSTFNVYQKHNRGLYNKSYHKFHNRHIVTIIPLDAILTIISFLFQYCHSMHTSAARFKCHFFDTLY